MIAIDDLCFSYPGSSPVFDMLSLWIERGERVALAGPNGGGKTTLFMLLSGLLKPGSGNIHIDGKQVVPHRFDPHIGYLFQSPDDQLFSPTVGEDVAFGPRNMGLSPEETTQRTKTALEQVNLLHAENLPPGHLSGGEKRLAALACLLTMQPELLLLDEPTANLDLKNRRDCIRVLNDLDMTMLIASHDLEFLLETCTTAAILDSAGIVEHGPIRTIFSDEPLLAAHHLEKPHSLIPHTHHSPVTGAAADH